MKFIISSLAVAAVVAGVPALADTWVVGTPGVSLTDAAQAKFNRDTRPDDRYVKPVPGNAGTPTQLYGAAGLDATEAQGLTLEQVFVAKINRESRGDEKQVAWIDGSTSASRGYGAGGDYSRLAASAGLSPEEAAGMSLDEIVAVKLAPDN